MDTTADQAADRSGRMSRVTHLSLSRSLVITFVLVLYQDTGQGVTLTSCRFEDSDLCEYDQLHDARHQFNWTRRSGAAPTADTGPSTAYEGNYSMYIEGGNNNEGGIAAFQTKGVHWTGHACVSLAYIMYGEDIGILNLSRSLSQDGHRLTLLYETRNQGNKWIRSQERTRNYDTNSIDFRIEGFKTTGSKGYIAIDDFSVVTGTCKTTVSLPYSCSFENDFCGMWQRASNHIEWLRTQKDNPAPETGSLGDSGGSWFISVTSDGQGYSQPLSIETPELNFTGDICVQFKYYLSSNVSTVVVYLANVDAVTTIFVINDSAATGATWRSVSLTVRKFVRKYSINFFGQFDGRQAARIALDKIYISRNICDDCAVDKGGCNQICSRTDTGRTCSCRSGYRQVGETGCQDIDECLAGTDACSHECQNEDGNYSCYCPGGWSLTVDGYNCQDIDECATDTDHECDHVCINVEGSYNCSCRVNYILAADGRHCIDIDEFATDTDHECDHVCINVEGSYNCSCPATYILATDGRHCIECESAYERRVAASQLQTSDCPTTSSHAKITLDDCLQEACSTQTGVVAYFNMVCNLKLCDGTDVRLKDVSGSTGWDIYVLNTTWRGFIMGGDSDEPHEGDCFPLVAVVAGVVVPVLLLVVIVIAVVFIVRRRGSREEDQSVQCLHYAGQPASVGEVKIPPIKENQTEVGIYDEIPECQAAVTNTQVTYRNAAFQGAHHYLDLDLGLGEYLEPTPKQQAAVTNTQVTYRNAAFQGAHRYLDLDLGLGEYLEPTPKQQAAVTNTQVTYRHAAFQGEHQCQDLDLGLGEYLTPTPKQHDDVQ